MIMANYALMEVEQEDQCTVITSAHRRCSRKRLILVEQASSALSELLGTAATI